MSSPASPFVAVTRPHPSTPIRDLGVALHVEEVGRAQVLVAVVSPVSMLAAWIVTSTRESSGASSMYSSPRELTEEAAHLRHHHVPSDELHLGVHGSRAQRPGSGSRVLDHPDVRLLVDVVMLLRFGLSRATVGSPSRLWSHYRRAERERADSAMHRRHEANAPATKMHPGRPGFDLLERGRGGERPLAENGRP